MYPPTFPQTANINGLGPHTQFAPMGGLPAWQPRQQFDPQSFWSTLKTIASYVPDAVKAVSPFLPQQAGPSMGQQPQFQQQPQFDPQGFWNTLISVAKTVAPLAPLVLLQAGPGQLGQLEQQPRQQFDPQSFWSTLKTIASYVPDAVKAVSPFLPQQASPLAQQPSQLAPQSMFGIPWRPYWQSPGIVSQQPDMPFGPAMGQA